MRMNYRHALRAKGVRPLPVNWQGRTVKAPRDLVLTRNDQPAIEVMA